MSTTLPAFASFVKTYIPRGDDRELLREALLTTLNDLKLANAAKDKEKEFSDQHKREFDTVVNVLCIYFFHALNPGDPQKGERIATHREAIFSSIRQWIGDTLKISPEEASDLLKDAEQRLKTEISQRFQQREANGRRHTGRSQ